MMVPRAFRYSSSPPKNTYDEKNGRRSVRQSTAPKTESAQQTIKETVNIPSKPVAVPTPQRKATVSARSMPSRSRTAPARSTRPSPAKHDPNALPPAVAALLAVTAIPPPRPGQFRKRSQSQRQVSIDELVNEWKSDDISKVSYGSSPVLSVLLEDVDDTAEECELPEESVEEDVTLHMRSKSSESVPSLEADDRSVLSLGSPSTPESIRSRKSSSNLVRGRARSLASTEDSSLSHPLVPASSQLDDEDEPLLLAPISRSPTPKPKSSFTSNLTTSLLALKNATISSLSSFTISTATAPSQRTSAPQFSDEMLWSHPFLFPHFSSEVRPAIRGTPTQAQRRYLNPMPLTFEEQEAPFQQALHAPFLAEHVEDVPLIQMQTYTRGRRKSNPRRTGPDPNSEAGRALVGPVGVRQREPRENSDFLRVVVLEMNMRREGKLESGRARIWLPPRQMDVNTTSEDEGRIPKRWEGVSAY